MPMLDNTLFGSIGAPGATSGDDDLMALLQRLQKLTSVEPANSFSIMPGMDVQAANDAEVRDQTPSFSTPAASATKGDKALAASQNPQTMAPSADSRFLETTLQSAQANPDRRSDVFYPFQTTTEPTNPPAPPMERPGVQFDAPPDYAGGGQPDATSGPSPTPTPRSMTSSAAPQRGPGAPPAPAPTRVAQASTGTMNDAAPNFGPTLLDRLTAAAYGSSGHMWDYRQSGEQARQAQSSAYQALIENGVSPATAKAAAMNPMIMQQLATRLGVKANSVWTQIGEDQWGNKAYGWVDPATRRVWDAAGNPVGVPDGAGSGGTTGSMVGGNDPITQAMRDGLKGQEFLDVVQKVDPGIANLVKKYGNYEIAMPTGAALRNPRMAKILAITEQVYPGFSAQDYTTSLAVKKGFGSGKDADEVKAYNTVMDHLTKAYNSVDKMGNFTSSWANQVWNPIRGQWDKDYQQARSHLLPELDLAIAEVNKAAAGKPITVTEQKYWHDKLGENASPVDLKSALQAFTDMIHGRMKAAATKYNTGLKISEDDPRAMSAEKLFNRDALQKFNRIMGLNPQEPAAGQDTTPPPPDVKDRPAIRARGLPKRPAGTRLPNPNFDPKKPESAENPMYVISDGED